MNHRLPKRYTILITRTGQPPLTLSFHPALALLIVISTLSIPLGWVGNLIYSYAHHNRALTQENDALTEEAQQILEQVEGLKVEIEQLQQRAGIEQSSSSSRPTTPLPSGGAGLPAEAALLLKTAKSQLPQLQQDLKGEIQPALEKTLKREEARPQGVPLKVRSTQSSEFGLRRNPFGRGYEFHEGLDFTAPYGSPIHVTAAGVVTKAELSKSYGYHVVVDHGYGYRTLYAHLSELAVTRGARVGRDRIIGYLGNTGRSSGPHLHYSVYRHQQPVDPKDYLN